MSASLARVGNQSVIWNSSSFTIPAKGGAVKAKESCKPFVHLQSWTSYQLPYIESTHPFPYLMEFLTWNTRSYSEAGHSQTTFPYSKLSPSKGEVSAPQTLTVSFAGYCAWRFVEICWDLFIFVQIRLYLFRFWHHKKVPTSVVPSEDDDSVVVHASPLQSQDHLFYPIIQRGHQCCKVTSDLWGGGL